MGRWRPLSAAASTSSPTPQSRRARLACGPRSCRPRPSTSAAAGKLLEWPPASVLSPYRRNSRLLLHPWITGWKRSGPGSHRPQSGFGLPPFEEYCRNPPTRLRPQADQRLPPTLPRSSRSRDPANRGAECCPSPEAASASLSSGRAPLVRLAGRAPCRRRCLSGSECLRRVARLQLRSPSRRARASERGRACRVRRSRRRR